MPLRDHSMVRLGKGQAILGGQSTVVMQAKIYSMTCSNKNCIISLLDRELSVPKIGFVAIPIPEYRKNCNSKACLVDTQLQGGLAKMSLQVAFRKTLLNTVKSQVLTRVTN